MNTTTTTRNPALRSNNARHMAEMASSSWSQAAGYRKLADLAATMGMEDEVDRCNRNADEYEQDGDECAERALLLGFDPASL